MTATPTSAGAYARRAAKSVAAAADRLRPPAGGVVVLLYHRVGRRSSAEIDLPADVFRRQMEVLAASGRARSLDAALSALIQPDPPPVDPVVVTFDDGTADFAEVALPILEGAGIPATLYLATDFVERSVAFPGDAMPLSWAALGDACSTGLVTVGSHTHTHALLDRLHPAAVDDELDRSAGLIQHRLGRPAEHFAYPKALAGSPAAAAAVRRRFRSAALAGTRANSYGRTDPHALCRSPIQVSDGMAWFHRKLAGGMALEDTLRRVLNRRRYAGATT